MLIRYFRHFPLFALTAILFSGCLTHAVDERNSQNLDREADREEVGLPPPERIVVGYMPSWTGAIEAIDFEKVTHINYAFHITTPEGKIVTTWTPEGDQGDDDQRLHALVREGKKNKVKVLLAVGGANDKNFKSFAVTEQGRGVFYDEIERVVRQYDLDGIDMDWEYPESSTEAVAFEKLMKGIRERLDGIDPELLLTAAVGVTIYGADYVSAEALKSCNWINLMTYDATGAWGGSSVGSTAPFRFAESGIRYWKEKGVEPARMTLGIPFYGINFTYYDNGTRKVSQIQYNRIWSVRQQSQAGGKEPLFPFDRATVADTLRIDSTAARLFEYGRNPLPSDSATVFLYWDSPELAAYKTAYALKENLRGVMIWELSQDVAVDSLSLLNAIWDVMLEVKSEISKFK